VFAKRSIFRFGIAAFLFLVQWLPYNTELQAGTLKDFKKGVEKEQADGQPATDKPAECGVGCQIFFSIMSTLGQMLIEYNTSIYYDDYPYAGKVPQWATHREAEKVTRREKMAPSSIPPGLAEDEEMCSEGMVTAYEYDARGKMVKKQVPRYGIRKKQAARVAGKNALRADEYEVTEMVMPDGKRSFFNFEAAGLYLDRETYGMGGGFQTRLLGWFGLIGEYRQYRDKSDKLTYTSFGADFALVQHAGFSWSAYVQYNAFSDLLALSGAGFGTRLQLFLGGRTALDFRIGKIAMTGIEFWDYDLRVGVFVNRVQIFVGYRAIESAEAKLAGFQGGMQLWL